MNETRRRLAFQVIFFHNGIGGTLNGPRNPQRLAQPLGKGGLASPQIPFQANPGSCR